MAMYQVKLQTRQGVKTLEIQGKNEAEARQMAARVGKILTLRKVNSMSLSSGLSPADRQIFFVRLASMLGSRVGTSEALSLLRETFTGKIQEVSGKLLNYVESGDDLASAIERVGSPHFPAATVALINAGAKSGETWRAIQDASRFETELAEVKKGAAKGLWAGAFGFLAAGVTTVGSVFYVGPKIMEMELMKIAAKKSPIDTGWIDTLGLTMGWIMAVLLVVAVLAVLLSTLGRKLLPTQADKLILKIPYFKDLVLARNNFIVLYGLALLIRSGVRIEEALRLSADGAPRGALRNDLLAGMDAVKKGRPWPKAMATLHPTDKASLMCAQDREQIAHTLDTLASQYKTLYAQRLASFVPSLHLLAAIFLTLSGGLLFGQSILPMLMAAQGLS